jgi:NAD binding domain of 6-phosphogluconate dehydrogenase
LTGAAASLGKDDDAGIVRLYLPQSPSAVHDAAESISTRATVTPTDTPIEINKIGFVGLGATGQGMASSLLRAGYAVCGYDLVSKAIQQFLGQGGKASVADSPSDAANEAEVFIVMVQNSAQVDEVLFGGGKAAQALPPGAVVVISSTVAPSFVQSVENRLNALGKKISLVDAPVGGGEFKAASGDPTVSHSMLPPRIYMRPVLRSRVGSRRSAALSPRVGCQNI